MSELIRYEKGQKIHNVIFLEEAESHKDRKAKFLCPCGNVFVAWIHSVKSNVIKSCGCYRKEYMRNKKTKHGLSRHPLYNTYNNMIERCYSNAKDSYEGVTVCDEWLKSFDSFFNWAINNGWRKELQLDKDIKGNSKLYSPENCIFVTPKQNSNKRKSSRFIEHDGIIKTLSEWAQHIGISHSTLFARLKMGWNMDRVINTPLLNKGKCQR